MLELKYPLFDGERVWDGAAVTVERRENYIRKRLRT